MPHWHNCAWHDQRSSDRRDIEGHMAQSPGHDAIPPPDKSFANALARVNIASQSSLLKREDGPSYVSFYKACSSSRLLKRQGIAVD